MKKISITIEDYLYEFYGKVAEQAGISTEKVMEDALWKLAGELSLQAIAKKNRQSE